MGQNEYNIDAIKAEVEKLVAAGISQRDIAKALNTIFWTIHMWMAEEKDKFGYTPQWETWSNITSWLMPAMSVLNANGWPRTVPSNIAGLLS